MELSRVEQRYRAVLAVEAGARVGEVAAQVGVSRQALSVWRARYRAEGLAGLADRSHRPVSCPHQASVQVETAVCELRREHPRWGPRRLLFELEKAGVTPLPSRMTVYRILVRHGLVDPKARRRRREDYKRWQRDAPMQLWQLDIVGGVLVAGADGQVAEVKVVTGIDDHSRYCVLATVVARPTGRAVCAAFATALAEFGVPDEVLTDNGKQFTDRFGKGGEVLFDRICRTNGIRHRLTQPASPTTTGKVERMHQTLRRELLDTGEIHPDLAAAQAALDRWRTDYNTARPHQALDMATPASRFRPVPDDERALLPLELPAALAVVPSPRPEVDDREPDLSPPPTASDPAAPVPVAVPWTGGPVEFERVVPTSGNMAVAGRQFWLGPARAGLTVTFWADLDIIHLTIAGARVKTVRSHLSVNDLASLAARGGRQAGPPPLPPAEPGAALEVDRTLNKAGVCTLANQWICVAEVLGGRRVSIRIDGEHLHVFDPTTRELLRTKPNPLTYDQARGLRGVRPAGPPPRPSVEPVTVQRRASNSGIIMVVGQKISIGRHNARRTVTIHVAETTITIDLGGGELRTHARTTTQPVTKIKVQRPPKAASVS
ncbi:IS481 family transposase [Frankia sp. CN6]|uniref:IS481 family transposase n=1 Tax=Frankia nepalensis TaxID=1836974 RepID=A0A937RC25_9ACTN|nr:IS481 family transposase [Frankia nepalensis]